MSTEKIIKAQAKNKLKYGGWAKALFALSLVVIFYMLIECVASVPNYIIDILDANEALTFIIEVSGGTVAVLFTLLISPVLLGFFRMFTSDDEEYFMGDVLYYFSGLKQYNKAVKFIFGFVLRMFFPTLVYSLPPIALYLFNYFINDNKQMQWWSNLIFVILIAVAVLLTLRHSIRYFLSVRLLCENEHEETYYYFKTSKEIMERHKKSVVKLFWSFFWWMLLSITGLPALYTIPYITQAFCISGKWLTELSRNGQEI